MKLAAACRCLAAFALLAAIPAQAQVFRAYLSLNGNDGNPCTLQQPCRLLPAALAATITGGEVWMLDSANYNTGPVTISQSVTILAIPGVVGSVVGTNAADAIVITAGSVVLRNLVFVPLPGATANDGVNMTGGTSLLVDRCLFSNMPNNGVEVTAPAASVRVIDSVFHNNGGGVRVQAAAASTTTAIDVAGSTFDGHASTGIAAFSSNASALLKGSIRDNRIVQNPTGIDLLSNAGASVSVSVSNNLVADGGSFGIHAAGTGTKLWATGNTISGNSFGVVVVTGAIGESAGNNAIRNNAVDVSGTLTVTGPS